MTLGIRSLECQRNNHSKCSGPRRCHDKCRCICSCHNNDKD